MHVLSEFPLVRCKEEMLRVPACAYKLNQIKSTLWLLLVKLQVSCRIGRLSVLLLEDPRSL